MASIYKRVLHVDGKTTVLAKGYIKEDGNFIGEYKFQGMTYGIELQPKRTCECESLGVNICYTCGKGCFF